MTDVLTGGRRVGVLTSGHLVAFALGVVWGGLVMVAAVLL